MAYTIGDVAKLAKVSVRTLHHYDSEGLLEPSNRSDAGYRLYSDGDLLRLQQILLYREFDFGLDEIKKILGDPAFDPLDALLEQRKMTAEKIARDEALLALLDKTILAMEGGIQMDKEEMFEVFGDHDPAQYEDEVKDRWGDTDAYKESARRTKGYRKEDWARIKAEGDAQVEQLVAVFDSSAAPDSPEAMDVAEEARLQIDRNFYPLTREAHVCLGDMYVADSRFTEYYDKHRPGLAAWFCDAIKANAAREG